MAMGMMGDKLTGLLGEDLTTPQAQAILAAGAQMMQAGGPQVGKPVSAGQAIGKGVQAGLDQLNKQKKQQSQIGRYKQQGTMVKTGTADFAGNAVFDSQTGTTMLQTPGGAIIPMPPDVEPSVKSLFGKEIIGGNNLFKIQDTVTQDENSLRQFSNYFVNNQIGTNEGLQRIADQFATHFKTLFNTGELSPQELALAKSDAELQALIGANRIAVVGGGVMTEQDAVRVLKAVGGDVDKLQNKEVLKETLETVYKRRFNTYETNYNTLVRNQKALNLPLRPKIDNFFSEKETVPSSVGNVSYTIK